MGEGEDVTDAVEEQKMNFGGTARGDERARARRWDRPAIWSFSKERRRVVKFTAQAAWIIVVVLAAREA